MGIDKRMTGRLALGVGLAMAMATPGAAQTVDVVGNFGGAGFAYGTGTGPADFTPSPVSTNCFVNSGPTDLTCYAVDPEFVPSIAQSASDTTQNFATNVVPGNFVFTQPGFGGAGSDSVLRFTAPTAGLYRVTGLFQRLDTTSNGNGVIASVFRTTIAGVAVPVFSTLIGTDGAGTPGVGLSFTRTFGLLSGGNIFFVVNNNGGDTSFDGTGLQAQIAAVPELGTWAMMLLGIGVIGGAARYRRRSTKVRFA